MALDKLKKQLLMEEKKRRKPKFRSGLLWLLLGLIALSAVVGGIVYVQQRSAWEMSRAKTAIEDRRYDQALQHLQRVYKRDAESPLAPEAMYRAGRILHNYRQDYRQAILLYLKMEDRYPESPFLVPALQDTAEIYKVLLQDHGRALGTYQRLVDLAPEQADRFQYEVAEGYFLLGNYEQARIEFEQLLRRWPETRRAAEVVLRIGLMYSLEGKLLESEEQFKKLLTNYPDSPYAQEAKIRLVGVYEERGELTTAMDLLKEIKQNSGDDPLIQKRLDQVQKRLSKKRKR